MESLLKDLLWLSRLESVRTQARREQVDIAGLLQELVDELRTLYPERTLSLQLDTREKIPGDYRELHSAVSNLILNAFKYSKNDSSVTVSWRQRDDELLLAVEDEGIGIDALHI
ncbi:MAG TPA: PAS domain-containing sensor histidine kinase, partial [Haliea salexigens]|nr:PAS domain-containing sensor histidine kinase [Haliea salexigens]